MLLNIQTTRAIECLTFQDCLNDRPCKPVTLCAERLYGQKKESRYIVPSFFHGKYSIDYKSCFNPVDDFNGNMRIYRDEIRFGVIMRCDVLKKNGNNFRVHCFNEDPNDRSKPFFIRLKKRKSGIIVNGKKFTACPDD